MIKIVDDIFYISSEKISNDQEESPLDSLPKPVPGTTKDILPLEKPADKCFEFSIYITWKVGDFGDVEKDTLTAFVAGNAPNFNYPPQDNATIADITNYIENPPAGHRINKNYNWKNLPNEEKEKIIIIEIKNTTPIEVECPSNDPSNDDVQPNSNEAFESPKPKASDIGEQKIKTGNDNCDPEFIDIPISIPDDQATNNFLKDIKKYIDTNLMKKSDLNTNNIAKRYIHFLPINKYSNLDSNGSIIPLGNPSFDRSYTSLVTKEGVADDVSMIDNVISATVEDQPVSFTIFYNLRSTKQLEVYFSLPSVYEYKDINIKWKFMVNYDFKASFKGDLTFKCGENTVIRRQQNLGNINAQEQQLELSLQSQNSLIKIFPLRLLKDTVFIDNNGESYNLGTTDVLFHSGIPGNKNGDGSDIPQEEKRILHEIKTIICPQCNGTGKQPAPNGSGKIIKCLKCKVTQVLTPNIENVLDVSLPVDTDEDSESIIICKNNKMTFNIKVINNMLVNNKIHVFQEQIDKIRKIVDEENKDPRCPCCLVSIEEIIMDATLKQNPNFLTTKGIGQRGDPNYKPPRPLR